MAEDDAGAVNAFSAPDCGHMAGAALALVNVFFAVSLLQQDFLIVSLANLHSQPSVTADHG